VAATQELVKLRAIQIKGCGFGTDMHTEDARGRGNPASAHPGGDPERGHGGHRARWSPGPSL
jgi:AhpD family alkylhydroperoxidase